MPMTRRLNPDQLGKKGEAQFQQLCTDARLIANPSSWDRKGWDFVVDWPLDENGPFDSRPTPFSCLVQVKTMWSGAKSVRLRLSSIEHLAKDLKPTFIYALEVDDILKLVGARIAHLDGDLLALVLKTLRQATADGRTPHKMLLNLSLERWFTKLLPTGEATRAAFEEAIGPTMPAYATSKQEQLRDLGFEDGRMIMRTTFEVDDEEHVLDAFLGLRKLNVLSGEATENRFGIELPLPDMAPLTGAKVEIKPQSHDTCDITVSDEANGLNLQFHGEIYGVPVDLLPEGRFKVLIRAALFDLVFDQRKLGGETSEANMTLKINSEIVRKAKVRASDWRNLYTFLAALARNPVQIAIKASKADQPLLGSASMEVAPETAGRWEEEARIADIADAMLERTGWPATKISLKALREAASEFDVLDAIVNEPASLSPLNFRTDIGANTTTVMTGVQLDALYFGVVELGRHFLVYAASLDLIPSFDQNEIRWTSSTPRFRDAARVKATKAAYDRFIADTGRRTGISTFLTREMIHSKGPVGSQSAESN
jgi:hypothetical protein